MYSKEDLKILTPIGFKQEFERNLSDYDKFKDAYEAVERKHISMTGKRHYADYNSFRSSISRLKTTISLW